MLFKILPKNELETLVEGLINAGEVIGPRRVKTGANGEPIYHFLPVTCFADVDLDYPITEFSAKGLFLPFQEDLSVYKLEKEDWTQEIQYWDKPRVLLGLHACDINGLLKLDKVFTKEFYPSPYYVARRKNTLIIGLDHMPCEGAFCRSLGMDAVTHGFDLHLTDLGDRYFVAVGSDKGFSLLRALQSREVTEQDTRKYLEVKKKIAAAFENPVNTRNLPNLMDLRSESEVWAKWGDKCLSCGTCAMVCPTCYCYDVTEQVSMDFKLSRKVKRLYSCNLADFALVAGGHNFRPDRHKRLMYRYYHQHRGFVETYGEPKCVGCNRCGRACLSEINPIQVIRDLQAEDRS